MKKDKLSPEDFAQLKEDVNYFYENKEEIMKKPEIKALSKKIKRAEDLTGTGSGKDKCRSSAEEQL